MKFEIQLIYKDHEFYFSNVTDDIVSFLNQLNQEQDFCDALDDFVQEIISDINPTPFGSFDNGNLDKLMEEFSILSDKTLPCIAETGEIHIYIDDEELVNKDVLTNVRNIMKEALLDAYEGEMESENREIDTAQLMIKSLNRFMSEGKWHTDCDKEAKKTIWFGLDGQPPIDIWTLINKNKVTAHLDFWNNVSDYWFLEYFEEFNDGYLNYWVQECGITTEKLPNDLLNDCPIDITHIINS